MTPRSCIILIFTCINFSALAQQQSLYWHNLKSVQLLNLEDGKKALTIIQRFSDDRKSNFNDKSDVFSVATSTPIDLELLISTLNDQGYFIADITNDSFHHPEVLSAGLNFQAALLYCYSAQKFIESGLVKIALTYSEYNFLTAGQQLVMDDCPYFFHIED